MTSTRKRFAALGLVLLVQLGLVGWAVNGQLSAHLTGEEYQLRVAPVDPIDPFRGAYVDLGYPDLALGTEDDGTFTAPPGDGPVYVPLVRDGEVWVGADATRTRPAEAPYLRCHDDGWRLACGIESLFLPQDKALQTERDLTDGGIATIRIDSRGNAVLRDVTAD